MTKKIHETSQVVGDLNDDRDIFVRDRQTDLIERVNVSSAGVEAQEVGATTGQGSMTASIGDDGRYVAFSSYASGDGRWVGFVSGATNVVTDPDTNGTTPDFYLCPVD